MPEYNFIRKSTGEEWTEVLTISEMVKKLEEDKDLDVIPGAPGIRDPFHNKKPPQEWRDLLTNMKKKHKHNNIEVF